MCSKVEACLMVCISFSVLSYTTDYYSKDESGITEHLKQALKECKSENLSVRQTMHVLKRGYMAKRQIGQCEAIYRVLPEFEKKQMFFQFLCQVDSQKALAIS